MSLDLHAPTPAPRLVPRVAVLGVGGAGGNAVDNMIRAKLEGIGFIVANTDAQALDRTLCQRTLQLGRQTTKGLGTGSRPEVGRAAAEESLEEVRAVLEDLHMVFITAGLGGGTGTGASPLIARAAREMGVLTVGVVTKPFAFEGTKRLHVAEQGLKELEPHLDTLLVIPNQNLFRIADPTTTFVEAFRLADDVLQAGVRSVTDLIVRPGIINLDFADVRAVIADMGRALMGAGEAEGEERAARAAEAAISNPLLDHLPIEEMRSLLVNVSGGDDLTLHEVEQAVGQISRRVDPAANLIFGSAFDTGLKGRLRVSVVATALRGPEAEAAEGAPRAVRLSLVSSRRQAETPEAANAPDEPVPSQAEPTDGSDNQASAPAESVTEPEAEPETWTEAETPAVPEFLTETETPAEPSTEPGPPTEVAASEAPPTPANTQGPQVTAEIHGLMSRLIGSWSSHPEDLFQRAERLYHGYGVPQSHETALRLYRRAARRGHAAAQNRLGWMLERGEGGETDVEDAARWHRKAADQGHLNAMNDLGYLYRQGRGVARDFRQAFYWFGQAAEKDYSYAEFNLGQMFENGWGVKRDLSEAVRWYRRAASHEHEWAHRRLRDLGVAV
jgi:cell division protein FtsZ